MVFGFLVLPFESSDIGLAPVLLNHQTNLLETVNELLLVHLKFLFILSMLRLLSVDVFYHIQSCNH